MSENRFPGCMFRSKRLDSRGLFLRPYSWMRSTVMASCSLSHPRRIEAWPSIRLTRILANKLAAIKHTC